MVVLLGYCRLITALNRCVATVVSAFVFIMVAVISYEVVSRYFFNAPTTWAMELATLLFGPYFLLAGPYILHTAGHVNVDILYRKLPFKLAGLVDCLTYALIVVVTVIFIDQSLPIALNAYASGETSFTSWNPPVWPVKALIPIAFLLLLMQALAEIIWAVKRIQGQEVKA